MNDQDVFNLTSNSSEKKLYVNILIHKCEKRDTMEQANVNGVLWTIFIFPTFCKLEIISK